jgi:hypothetical protein
MHYSPVTITPAEANISGNNDCGEPFFVLALIKDTGESALTFDTDTGEGWGGGVAGEVRKISVSVFHRGRRPRRGMLCR